MAQQPETTNELRVTIPIEVTVRVGSAAPIGDTGPSLVQIEEAEETPSLDALARAEKDSAVWCVPSAQPLG